MAKQSSLGSAFFAGIYDISGDVGSIGTIETTRAALDVTGIDKSALERITGRRDGTMSFNAFFNTAAGQEHIALSALLRTDLQASVFIGSTVGDAAASVLGKQLTYSQALGADGSLVNASSVAGNGNGLGVEWGEMLTTGKQSFATGTVNGTSIDLGSASTAFGAAAYLHVFTMPSGTATFAVQDSTDNITFNNVTGMAFTG
ncbi:hypothetical protein UFOVP960_47, partial [uncultured Caudovirales phage]